VDGLLKDRRNYQGVNPDELGREHTLVLGKHSGRHAVQRTYANMGLWLDARQAEDILGQIRGYVTRAKRPPGPPQLLEFYQCLSGGLQEAACQ
jgi:homocitrate synthase NifV